MVDTTIKAFEAIGRAIGDAAPVAVDNITIEFDGVVAGQLGLNESELPPQPSETIGNLTSQNEVAVGLPWPKALAVEWANRYVPPTPTLIVSDG
jgi:alpha,alpha-trehalase